MTFKEILEHEDFDTVPSLFRGFRLSTWFQGLDGGDYDPTNITFELGWLDENEGRWVAEVPEWLMELTKDVFERIFESEDLMDYSLNTNFSEGNMCIVSLVEFDDIETLFPIKMFQSALHARVKQILS
jgi:hypothetical protein